MQNLLNDLATLLATDQRFVIDGKPLKNKIIESALNLDPDLLKLLLQNETIKKHFFQQVGDLLVFDKIKFQKFVSNKQFLPDSYTAFKNKIGLTVGDDFISDKKEVVLSWPYKDCVLEGGQTKEDQKRSEIFWNETLAPDEIDRLLSPKVFTNFKRYTKNGEEEVTSLSDNENYIIKGNNLIALHSLAHIKAFKGKIKLIFIDPPYNTENDSFRYNDTFNHTSWLTFMKNRIEIAHRILADNGLIWVSLSDKEAHYFKVLMDEIFGQENFVADVIWNSTKSVTNTAIISDAHTHLLLYAKKKTILKEKRTSFRLSADESKFSNPDNDPRGKWVADPFQVGGERPNQLYEITNPNTGAIYKPLPGNSWKNEKKVFDTLFAENRIVFGTSGDAGPQRKRFWTEAKERGEVTTTLWKDLPTTTNGTQHLKALFSEKVFENPKPEGLLERIIQLSTDENDIVLDFFLGSGTTCAVAHKMKRKYVGIEQMEYIKEVSVPRLRKVIEGESGGISKSQKWRGGGSFIYCELFSKNQHYIDLITNANDNDLNQVAERVFQEACVDYRVTNAIEKDIILGFENLDVNAKKNVLLQLLDKNELYLSYSEMKDKDSSVNKQFSILTTKLYSND